MSFWTLFTIYSCRISTCIKRPLFISQFKGNFTNANSIKSYKMAQNADSDIFEWTQPSSVDKHLTGLVVYNSFTKSKVPFIPEQGNVVKWYSCGPTVYDHSHLGHARTYITTDVIRRILEYLGYRVNFIMNITDVDDKIIARSSELGINFSDFAKKWEMDFWNDMDLLGVRYPNCITRVSEFIPEIIKFIEKIIERGYAYQSKGSVYFDIETFSSKHNYARMEHSSVQIKERTLEGEGELGEVFDKKSPIDFALWKQAKHGEPFWNSPWGNGRPGWHIECSVMASELLGEKIDIHSGGVDLRFPHHDNEIAQSEAYFDKSPWINYFLHFGHLHIHGSKMSKSLKNFITIKEFLGSYSPRQLRLLFLMSRWDSAMNYSKGPDGMQHIVALDTTFSNFFPLIKSVIKNSNNDLDLSIMANSKERWDQVDKDLFNEFITCVNDVELSLRDNFDTLNVIHSLQRLISSCNSYITTNHTKLKKPLLSEILYKVSRYFEMLGLDYQTEILDADSEGLIDQIIKFRTKIRLAAKSGLKNDSTNACKEILSICDNLRDVGMPSIGFKMEDLPDGNSLVKKSSLEKSSHEKALDEKSLDKPDNGQTEAAERLSSLSLDSNSLSSNSLKKEEIEPRDYFHKLYPGKFGDLDESFIPISYSNGQPVSKSERKSLEKIMNKHIQKRNK